MSFDGRALELTRLAAATPDARVAIEVAVEPAILLGKRQEFGLKRGLNPLSALAGVGLVAAVERQEGEVEPAGAGR